jgi:hypothetical protein
MGSQNVKSGQGSGGRREPSMNQSKATNQEIKGTEKEEDTVEKEEEWSYIKEEERH